METWTHDYKNICLQALCQNAISSLVGLMVSKHMPATYQEVLVRPGFESHWSRISVAVPVVYLAMLSL